MPVTPGFQPLIVPRTERVKIGVWQRDPWTCWGEGNSRERKMELKIQEGSRKGGKRRGGRRGGEEEEKKEETEKEADMEETDFRIVL